jgi:hypothetical protein
MADDRKREPIQEALLYGLGGKKHRPDSWKFNSRNPSFQRFVFGRMADGSYSVTLSHERPHDPHDVSNVKLMSDIEVARLTIDKNGTWHVAKGRNASDEDFEEFMRELREGAELYKKYLKR